MARALASANAFLFPPVSVRQQNGWSCYSSYRFALDRGMCHAGVVVYYPSNNINCCFQAYFTCWEMSNLCSVLVFFYCDWSKFGLLVDWLQKRERNSPQRSERKGVFLSMLGAERFVESKKEISLSCTHWRLSQKNGILVQK